jgi:hypothetical protein
LGGGITKATLNSGPFNPVSTWDVQAIGTDYGSFTVTQGVINNNMVRLSGYGHITLVNEDATASDNVIAIARGLPNGNDLLEVRANGSLAWGTVGGSMQTLYKQNSTEMRFSDQLRVLGNLHTNGYLYVGTTTNSTYLRQSSSTIVAAGPNLLVDSNLYVGVTSTYLRSYDSTTIMAENNFLVDDNLYVGSTGTYFYQSGGLMSSNGSIVVGNRVYLGAQTDNYLYRYAANIVASSSSFRVNATLYIGSDCNLYRSTTNTLRTNDSLIVDGTLNVSSTSSSYIGYHEFANTGIEINKNNLSTASAFLDFCNNNDDNDYAARILRGPNANDVFWFRNKGTSDFQFRSSNNTVLVTINQNIVSGTAGNINTIGEYQVNGQPLLSGITNASTSNTASSPSVAASEMNALGSKINEILAKLQ